MIGRGRRSFRQSPPRRLAGERTAPEASTAPTVAMYLYGICRNPGVTAIGLGTGVGDPPGEAFLIPFQQIAAVASEVSADAPPGGQARGLRRDMLAHNALLNRLLETTTVLPIRFGVCHADRRSIIEEILRPQHDCFDEQLNRLAGAVELTLHVRYREAAVLHEIWQEQGMATAPMVGARGGFRAKLERGRRIVEAVEHRSRSEGGRILARLQPLAREMHLAEPTSERSVIKASFLVNRDALERFDRAIEELHGEMQDRMEWAYVGPLPPYSFARMPIPG